MPGGNHTEFAFVSAIVARLGAEPAKLDALRSGAERTMTLLKERRAALIAAAITGKMDVRAVRR